MENAKVTSNSLKQLEQILAKRQSYVITTNQKAKRNLDTTNGTLSELAVFVATLVEDLKKQGILK